MNTGNMKRDALLFTAFYCALLASVTSSAETTTTTTTTTNPDGTTTTTVEETTTTGEPETTSQETQPASQPVGRNLVGPAGVTGTIRRADRRQDRRLEDDLDDLEDAIEGRPRRWFLHLKPAVKIQGERYEIYTLGFLQVRLAGAWALQGLSLRQRVAAIQAIGSCWLPVRMFG